MRRLEQARDGGSAILEDSAQLSPHHGAGDCAESSEGKPKLHVDADWIVSSIGPW
jgi:hypothetical protein